MTPTPTTEEVVLPTARGGSSGSELSPPPRRHKSVVLELRERLGLSPDEPDENVLVHVTNLISLRDILIDSLREAKDATAQARSSASVAEFEREFAAAVVRGSVKVADRLYWHDRWQENPQMTRDAFTKTWRATA